MWNEQGGGMDRRAFLVRVRQRVALGVGLLSLDGGVKRPLDAAGPRTATVGNMTSLSLQESYINNAEFAGYYCAAKKGYLQEVRDGRRHHRGGGIDRPSSVGGQRRVPRSGSSRRRAT
jgi:hypothetical protein